MIDIASARELRLELGNRPLTTVAAELVRLAGRRVTLPGVGYIVNDADLILEIVQHDAFTCSGPGSLGGMITPVLGESALFNMDGERHLALKSQISASLGKGAIGDSIDASTAELLAALRADLAAGQVVDLMALTRQLSNALICRLFGLRLTPEEQERAGCRTSQLSTTLTSYQRVEKLQLSAAEAGVARHQCAQLRQFAEQGFRLAGPNDPSLPGVSVRRRVHPGHRKGPRPARLRPALRLPPWLRHGRCLVPNQPLAARQAMFDRFNRPTPARVPGVLSAMRYPPQRILQPEARASPFNPGLTDY